MVPAIHHDDTTATTITTKLVQSTSSLVESLCVCEVE